MRRAGGRLHFGVAAARVPQDVRWVIDVSTPEGRLGGVWPIPDSADGRRASHWTFESHDGPVAVAVGIELSRAERAALVTQRLPTAYLQPLLWALTPLGMFLVVLVLIRADGPLHERPSVGGDGSQWAASSCSS